MQTARTRMFALIAAAALAALAGGCASRPTAPAAQPPAAAPAPPVVAHGAVSSSEARRQRMDALIATGVAPIEDTALPGYLDALEAKLRAAIAGNTASIARVHGEVVVVLPARVLFVPDAAELTQAGEKFLGRLAETLRGESSVLIEVSCHTDRLGNPADNLSFTSRRADRALAALVAGSVDSGHLIAIGSGDRFPVADNVTADGRRLNRRVELSLIPVVR